MSDLGSNRIKEIARLSQKDARSQTGLFLLEGPQGLKELASYPDLIVDLFATAAAQDRYQPEFGVLRERGVVVTEVSEKTMERISDTRAPQGVLAVLHQFDVELEELTQIGPRLVAVMERISDPGNAGTVLRAADAAGADGLVLSKDSVDVFNPKVVRSTAGSLLHLPVVRDVEVADAIGKLKAAGLQVFAASGSGDAITELSQAELARPTAWVFGNEAAGVSEETLALCDRVVSIPIFGGAESLNLATAAAICLYTSAFAQRANH